MKLSLKALTAALLLSSIPASAAVADYNVIPLPKKVTLFKPASPNSEIYITTKGKQSKKEKEAAALLMGALNAKPFILGGKVKIEASKNLKKEAEFLKNYLKVDTYAKSSGKIVLRTTLKDENPEAYSIFVTDKEIIIDGASPAGVFYGMQTLRKSMPADLSEPVTFPAGEIDDAPRFSYRGTHLDVARHFFNADEVKKFIDIISLHNVNTFHWHLTDDQGWRIEIKKYPRLTEVGSYRPGSVIGRTGTDYDSIPVFGFYTQDEIRDIIKYAADRHITVIPEIDLPSHMMAALASYPELGCTGGPYDVWKNWGVEDNVLCPGKDHTMEFIADVLNEVMDIFPAPFIHIGGDECPKTQWKKCPDCQARIKELGIKATDKASAEDLLQGYVTKFAADVAAKHGKSVIGWDEILECDVPGDAVIMSWRGVNGAVDGTARGHRVILTPNTHLYFDFYQSKDIQHEPFAIGGLCPVDRVYSFEPISPDMTPEQQKLVLGAQSNLWTEYVKTFDHVQYMELPRLAALCEVQWTEPEKKDFQSFKDRIPALFALYDRLGYNYAKHLSDVAVDYSVDHQRRALKVDCSTIKGNEIRYTLDGNDPTEQSQLYTTPLYLNRDCVIKTVSFHNGKPGQVICDTLHIAKSTFADCELAEMPWTNYTFAGAQTLVDGLTGTGNYRTGRWLGFYGIPCDATISFQEPREISEVDFNCCIFSCDGVLDSRGVEVYTSDNGTDYTLVASEDYPEMDPSMEFGVSSHSITFDPVEAKSVRVVIKPEVIIPSWHALGNGKIKGFLFVDEISVK